jgi:heme A synthase
VTTDQISRHQENTAAAALLATVVGLAGVGFLVQRTGHPLAVGVAVTTAGVLTAVVRWVARWLRERREDRADALAAAAWRARHLPHSPAPALPGQRERAGVS